MKITEAEVLALVLEWMQEHVEQSVLTRLFEDIPSAHIILNDISQSELKLRQLRRLEGTED